jgi:CRISPR/Cas system endoribonuclease Cas6 (RAMP superfamily)
VCAVDEGACGVGKYSTTLIAQEYKRHKMFQMFKFALFSTMPVFRNYTYFLCFDPKFFFASKRKETLKRAKRCGLCA